MSASIDLDGEWLPDVDTNEFEALKTTVHQAVEHADIDTLASLHVTTLRHVDCTAFTRLVHVALQHRQVHVVAWLVEESARTGVDIANGWTSAHVAGLLGDMQHLTAACDEALTQTTSQGATVLHAAVLGDQDVAIEYLLRERDVDEQSCDYHGLDALSTACSYGCVHAVVALAACGVQLTHQALVKATWNGHVDAMERLVELGVDATVVDHAGSVLHVAARCGRVDVVECAVRLGVDPLAVDQYGRTALHAATSLWSLSPGLMERLVQIGVPLNDADERGQTALHAARSSPQACRALLELGADRWIQANDGRTARDVALSLRRTLSKPKEVAELLDTYYPIVPSMVQLLLGLRGPTESPLTRLAAHSLFEPNVLSLVNCLLTGKDDKAYEQLVHDSLP